MTTLAPVAGNTVSQVSLAPVVLSPEQTKLQEQIGTPSKFAAWAKGAWASMVAKWNAASAAVSPYLEKAKAYGSAAYEAVGKYIGSDPKKVEWIKLQAAKQLAKPEIQAKLKLIPAVTQAKLLDVAVDAALNAPGAKEKWNAIKAEYGPVVTQAIWDVAVAAGQAAAGALLEAVTGTVSSMRVAPVRDGFVAAPAAR